MTHRKEKVCRNIYGMKMLLAFLLNIDPQGSESYSLRLVLRCPSGERIPFNFDFSKEHLSKKLFHKVEHMTGISQDLQMLSYKMQMMSPDTPLCEYHLEDHCYIDLSVKGVGGGGGNDSTKAHIGMSNILHDCIIYVHACEHWLQVKIHVEGSEEILDECVSCGEYANNFCNKCESSRCAVCNEQWHKHPKRRNHKIRVWKPK